MALKNILVHVEDSDTCEARIAAALTLAETHDAHLTGLALAVEISMPSYIGGQLPPNILEMQRNNAREQGQAAVARFSKAVRASGRPTDCRMVGSLDVDASRVIALHARHSDLAILGQVEPDDSAGGMRRTLEEVVLSCGRPVLIVPYIGVGAGLGKRVVVAWDSGREATRAVNDALPILERAEQVTVLTINPKTSPDGHGEEPGTDIALHLARHGVKVEVQQSRGEEIGVGDALLSRVADRGGDLLVMGAYGHSRLREVVLGGATRSILEQMTIPVLMSH